MIFFFKKTKKVLYFPGRLLVELRPVGQRAGREPWCLARESRIKRTKAPEEMQLDRGEDRNQDNRGRVE